LGVILTGCTGSIGLGYLEVKGKRRGILKPKIGVYEVRGRTAD
jgi:hypothetical protein